MGQTYHINWLQQKWKIWQKRNKSLEKEVFRDAKGEERDVRSRFQELAQRPAFQKQRAVFETMQHRSPEPRLDAATHKRYELLDKPHSFSSKWQRLSSHHNVLSNKRPADSGFVPINSSTSKMVVGKLLSFWEGLFSGVFFSFAEG